MAGSGPAELTCPICFNDYDIQDSSRVPKLLDCRHTFCVLCIVRSLEEDGSLKCFICHHIHKNLNTGKLIDNYVITNHLRNIQEKNDHEIALHFQQEMDKNHIAPAAPKVNVAENSSGQANAVVLNGNQILNNERGRIYQAQAQAQVQDQEQARWTQQQTRQAHSQVQEQTRQALIQAQGQARQAHIQAQEYARMGQQQARLARAHAQEQTRRVHQQARLAQVRAQEQARMTQLQAQEQARRAQFQAQEQARMAQQQARQACFQVQEQGWRSQQQVAFQTAGHQQQQQQFYAVQSFFCDF